MQFTVQIAVEADSGKEAANKVPDEVGTVIAVNPRSQAGQLSTTPSGHVITGGQFERTTTGQAAKS